MTRGAAYAFVITLTGKQCIKRANTCQLISVPDGPGLRPTGTVGSLLLVVRRQKAVYFDLLVAQAASLFVFLTGVSFAGAGLLGFSLIRIARSGHIWQHRAQAVQFSVSIISA